MRAVIAFVLAGCGGMFAQKPAEPPQPPMLKPDGPLRMVIKNATRGPLCELSAMLDVPRIPNMGSMSPIGYPKSKVERDEDVVLMVREGTYSFHAQSCGNSVSSGALTKVEVHGPIAIAVVDSEHTHFSPPPGYAYAVLNLKYYGGGGARSSAPAEHCLPAGDISTADGHDCCSGTMTSHSTKHPGPSHCSYPDEL